MDLEPLPPEPVEGNSPTSEFAYPPAAPDAPAEAVSTGRWSMRTRLLAGAVAAVTVGAGAFAIASVVPAGTATNLAAARTAATPGGSSGSTGSSGSSSPEVPAPGKAMRMRAAEGKVSNLSGSSFTVTASGGGSTETTNVVTSSSTTYTKTKKGAVSDIKVGQQIAAKGTRAADGSLAASSIVVVPAGSGQGKGGMRTGHAPKASPVPNGETPEAPMTPPSPPPVAFGTVQSNVGGVITVTAPSGTQKVTTTPTTTVIETVPASAADVTNGITVAVIGTPSADGTHIDANRVDIIDPTLQGSGSGKFGPGFGPFPGYDGRGPRGWPGPKTGMTAPAPAGGVQ